MVEWLGNVRLFKISGYITMLITLLGVILPWIVYRGKEGEKYSLLNHYISELGERGVSRWAWVFNLCLVLAGLGVTLCTISLGLGLVSFWAKLGLLFGVVTGVGMIMVGIFPMNNIKPHATAAMTFFRGGLLMVLAFSLAILFPTDTDEVIPRIYGLVGLFPIAAFAYFLGLVWKLRDNVDQTFSTEGIKHPQISKLTVSEWAVFISIILWTLVLSLAVV